MKNSRKCSKKKITVDDKHGVTDAFQVCLSCASRSKTVRKLLDCLDRLHSSEEKERFESLFEEMIDENAENGN